MQFDSSCEGLVQEIKQPTNKSFYRLHLAKSQCETNLGTESKRESD